MACSYYSFAEKGSRENSIVKQWRSSGFLVTALESHNDIITAVDCDESLIVSARWDSLHQNVREMIGIYVLASNHSLLQIRHSFNQKLIFLLFLYQNISRKDLSQKAQRSTHKKEEEQTMT